MPVTLSLAVRYFKAAADQGLAPAQYNLGYALKNGQGRPVNLSMARTTL